MNSEINKNVLIYFLRKIYQSINNVANISNFEIKNCFITFLIFFILIYFLIYKFRSAWLNFIIRTINLINLKYRDFQKKKKKKKIRNLEKYFTNLSLNIIS